MRKLIVLLVLCFALPAFSQVRWDIGSPGGSGVTSVSGSGQPFLIAQPNVTLNFCAYPANTIPCTNFAPTFTDLTLSTQCPSNAQVVLQGGNTCQSTSDNYGNLGVYTNAGSYSYTLTVGAVSFGPFTLTLGGGGSGPGSTVQGTANQIQATFSNPQIISFANPTSFPGPVTIPGGQFTLSGNLPGQGYTSNASGLTVQTSAPIAVGPFTVGIDPCDKIATGQTQLPSSGNGIVDARGLGTGNLTPCSAATAHAMFAGSTSGYTILPNATLWVPLSEAAPAVACAAPHAASMCLPPQGVIPLPNKFIGVIGSGRGDASTSLGSTIAVCKGLNNPVPGCTAPATRNYVLSSTDITYAGGRTYLGLNFTGGDIAAGEPIRIEGSGTKANDIPGRACNLDLSNSTRTDANCPADPISTKLYAPVPSGVVSVTLGGTNTGYTSPVTVNVTKNSCTAAPVLTATQSGGVVNSVIVQFPGYGCTSTGGGPPTATLTSGGSSNATLVLNIETACASNCGVLVGEIPVFDLPLLTVSNGNQFAQQLRYLSTDCEGVISCVGFRSLSGNEQSGLDHVKISGSPERAIDIHTFIAQNGDTLKSLELYGGTSLGANCDPTTTAAFFGENGPHGLTDTTVNFGNCAHTVIAGFVIDTNTYPMDIDKSHCENTQKCYLAGQDSPAQYFNLANDAGGPSSQCGDASSMSGVVNTSGTAVTWVSGNNFNEYFAGQVITINGSPFTVGSSADDTHLTLTGSAGTLSNKAYSITTSMGNCVPGDGPYQYGTSSVVTISPSFTGNGTPSTKDFTIMTMVRSTAATNIIEDWRNTSSASTDHISNQNSLEFYSFDNSPTGCLALITTDATIPNNICFLQSPNTITAPGFATTNTNGGMAGTEGTGANIPIAAGSGVDQIYPDSTSHCWHQDLNNVDYGCVPRTIASGAKTLNTTAVSSATCGTVQTATATGTLTTDRILVNFNGDPTAVTGYVPLTAGMLTIIVYPTADTVNVKVCNNTSSSITPGAITLNWSVIR